MGSGTLEVSNDEDAARREVLAGPREELPPRRSRVVEVEEGVEGAEDRARKRSLHPQLFACHPRRTAHALLDLRGRLRPGAASGRASMGAQTGRPRVTLDADLRAIGMRDAAAAAPVLQDGAAGRLGELDVDTPDPRRRRFLYVCDRSRPGPRSAPSMPATSARSLGLHRGRAKGSGRRVDFQAIGGGWRSVASSVRRRASAAWRTPLVHGVVRARAVERGLVPVRDLAQRSSRPACSSTANERLGRPSSAAEQRVAASTTSAKPVLFALQAVFDGDAGHGARDLPRPPARSKLGHRNRSHWGSGVQPSEATWPGLVRPEVGPVRSRGVEHRSGRGEARGLPGLHLRA
jgi:hypothetical protein